MKVNLPAFEKEIDAVLKWIDLAQAQWRLRTALQIAPHEAILRNAQLQRRRTGIRTPRSRHSLKRTNGCFGSYNSVYSPENPD